MADQVMIERPLDPPGRVTERPPDRPTENLLMAAYRSAIGATGATYVSMPITTGELLVCWYESHPGQVPSSTERRLEVMEPNVRAGAVVVGRARAARSLPAIDPSALTVPGWGQPEYNAFWRDVIYEHARSVTFVDGWEFSTGCCIELQAARHRRLPITDQHLQPLDDRRAVALLAAAVERLSAVGLACVEQRQAISSLNDR